MGAAACNLGKTDLGDLDTDGQSSGPSEDSGDASESGSDGSSDTAPAPECLEDDNCQDGCCEGFGCNFANQCVACSAAGEFLDIDGAGCCEGLIAGASFICYDSACDEDGCDEGIVACAPVNWMHDADQFVVDCAPEACITSRTSAVSNAAGQDGLLCTGPDGSDDCQAVGEDALQQYSYAAEGVSIHLDFDPAVLEEYSTASFNEHFSGFVAEITLPDATVPVVVHPQADEISAFVYADGRLQFTITLPDVDGAFAMIESDAEDCLSDDIAGVCACYYDSLGMVEIAVDLSIEAPA